MVISDAHRGFNSALASELLLGGKTEKRQQFHTHSVDKGGQERPEADGYLGALTLRPARRQGEGWAQHGRVVEQLDKRFNEAAEDILAFTFFPTSPYGGRCGPTTPRSDSTARSGAARRRGGFFPNHPAIVRLVVPGWPSRTTSGLSPIKLYVSQRSRTGPGGLLKTEKGY
jgi:hypothetical protein